METYDAVVIGSGAAGACSAYEMANKGMKVLMLEKGPNRKTMDFHEGGVFGNPFTSRGRGDELKFIREHYIMPNRKKEVRELDYRDHTGKQRKSGRTSYGWMSQLVGGGTIHYGGASFRYDRIDFEMEKLSEIARELEIKNNISQEHRMELRSWPIEFNELIKWYTKAEKDIGIAGAPESGLPPLPWNKAGILIRRGLAMSNFANIDNTPMAINSAKHDGRDNCHMSGLCQDYGCRFDAKSDMRVTLIKRALATGNLTIKAETFVRKLLYSQGKVTHVETVVGNPDEDAKVEIISCPILVIGCEAMETNRLMLASGLGNPDVVGKYIMFHMTGGARSIAPEKTNTWTIPPHTSYINTFYNDHDHESNAPFLKTGVLLVSSNGGPLQASNYWGEKGRLYLNKVYPYKMDLSYIGDCMPVHSNKIELKGHDNRYGCPGTKITYRPHQFDHNAAVYMAEKAKKVLSLAGGLTEDTVHDDRLRPFLDKSPTAHRLFHGCGGCRMGEDPKTSVVDRNCKVHGIDNLYITDASVFPTSGGRNPTLTIQAIAMKAGNHIATAH